MLFLVFRLGQDRYALDAAQIAEVLPVVRIKQLPHGPPELLGLLDYRGRPVPIFDVNLMTLGQPAQRRLSTRIILVHYPPAGPGHHLLGLMVERATQTVRRNPADFMASGIRNDGAPYLGPVCTDEHGLIQWMDVDRLLSDSLRERLFPQKAAIS